MSSTLYSLANEAILRIYVFPLTIGIYIPLVWRVEVAHPKAQFQIFAALIAPFRYASIPFPSVNPRISSGVLIYFAFELFSGIPIMFLALDLYPAPSPMDSTWEGEGGARGVRFILRKLLRT